MAIKKILLLSHIPARDEIPDILLANSLTSSDVCVWKHPILAKAREAICLIKPDIVILPEVRLEFTRDLAMLCKSWGIKVVQKRCEMGISRETEITDELERCIFGNLDWMSCVDLDLVWGEEFASMLVEHGVPESKIKVIGGIGFDPYFAGWANPPVRQGTRVMFATGFGYADCSPLYAAPESKPGERINIDLVKADRENRCIFQDMMAKVIKKFPDYTYGVRQHPGEVFHAYGEVFKEKIICLESIVTPMAVSWADVIIHTGSTMAYEAHLLNKPTINFRNTSLDKVVGKIGPIVNTSEEVIDLLGGLEFEKSNADPAVIKDLERYYGVVDGKAGKRAAEAILNLEINQTNIPNEWPKDTLKYITKGVYANLVEWKCAACNNVFWVQKLRAQVKCPYCGIGCVQRRYFVSHDDNGDEVHTQAYESGDERA